MTFNLTIRILVLALFSVSVASQSMGAERSVRITVDPEHPGISIPSDFAGLSFEVALVLPGPKGLHYFRPDNLPLLNLFRTLGIKSLRIGGNTSDRDAKRLPDEADLDSLFTFAKAAGVKVIYCLRLHNGNPQEQARVAKYIMTHYAPLVECLSIGQEPSAYPIERTDSRPNSEHMGTTAEKYRYESYRIDWKRFSDAIIAEVPDIKFCGPGVHNNADWARRFIADFRQSNHVALITEHLYPGGAGGKVPSPDIGRDRMLSPEFVRVYQRLYDGFVPMARSNALPCRLEEVNNFFNGGATNVSNTFASALWGLDFMYWWASHDLAGVNFHTGDRVAAGSKLQPSKYTAFFSIPNGFEVRPLGYGIKAFALGGSGRFLPLANSAQPETNLSAYAVLSPDDTLYLTLINKEHGIEPGDILVEFKPNSGYATAHTISLRAPNNDIAATTGVTLGGASIAEDGSWNGTWQPLSASEAGEFQLRLPAASAAIVKLTKK